MPIKNSKSTASLLKGFSYNSFAKLGIKLRDLKKILETSL